MKHFFTALLVVLASCSAFAQTFINTVGSDDSTAISGFDPVGFLVQKKALAGSPNLAYEYSGAKWLFSSPENLELFKANPDQYIPAWGGQCAWAVSEGVFSTKKLSGSFEVIDGKVYLFAFGNNTKTGPRDDFLYGRVNRATRMKEGEKHWSELKKRLESGSLVQPNSSNYTKTRFE